ncbi:VOC family protein [Arthrobacter zhaoguopingii]|uniref:VOC family protein n=1 Tax=Arthrobacter zhaoguopingii TaxID=2681491 RepID=UPI001359BEBB|nr:VOC family protein [Arthrobacter zhaoguopingii]
MIGSWQATVLDCPDPGQLATFYQNLFGMVRVDESDDWITIGDAADRPALAFQLVENYTAPKWPGQEVPQQMHLDVLVADLDEAEAKVLAGGAVSLNSGTGSFRVYLDPAGHPFCLVAG